MKAKNEWEFGVDKDVLRSLFEYRDGSFVRIGSSRVVGWKDSTSGYRRVQIGENTWMEHRLIWIYHHGNIPDLITVDHEDHNVENNRIDNLRLGTRSEQNKYQRKRRECSSKYIGVCWRERNMRYEITVGVMVDGKNKQKYIGSSRDELVGARMRDSYIVKHGLLEWNLLNFH